MKLLVFQTVPLLQRGYIYSALSGIRLQGPFLLEQIENTCIYCISSV